MVVKTKNETYTFTVCENSLRVTVKFVKEYLITEITNLEIGKEMRMKGYSVNSYNGRIGDEVFIESSPITEIQQL